MNITVEYLLESGDMTDSEYENQKPRKFTITSEMIENIITQNVEIPEGNWVDSESLYEV